MNVVCIGAHPDDAEVFAGGVMTRFAQAGHNVFALSLTNGDAGHYCMDREALAVRRAQEAREAAIFGGYTSIVLDHHDGELVADLSLRKEVTRIIRECEADLVFTHRPNDYHPDHRYTAQVVQDAAFMVTVPMFCPETSALQTNPVFLYLYDGFTCPAPFRPDVVVDVDAVMPLKWRLLDAMDSQFYEWLPWLAGRLEDVPPASRPAERLAWLEHYFASELEKPANTYRDLLRRQYGDGGDGIRFVEVFQLCEYGSCPDASTLGRMFVFDQMCREG